MQKSIFPKSHFKGNKNNSSNKKKKSINNNDNIEIDTIKKSLWNKLIIVNKINNIEIVSNNDKVEENKDNNKINEIKKFDIILMEQKDYYIIKLYMAYHFFYVLNILHQKKKNC